MSGSFKRIADILVTVCIVVVSIATVATLLQNRRPAHFDRLPTVKPGEAIHLSAVDWSKFNKSVVLAIRENCPYCQQSVPFYEELSKRLNATTESQIIAISPDPPDATLAYLSEHGVRVATAQKVSLGELKLPATPTLLVVGSSGRVERVWVGKLDPSGQCQVFRALNLACS